MANSLFITHIPAAISLEDLHEMFKKDHFTINRIESLETPDRAMVTCPDQCVADRIIDKYNGRFFHGLRLVVEPWMEYSALISRKRSAVHSIQPNPYNTDPLGLFPRPTKPFVFTESSCTREFVPREIKGSESSEKFDFEEEMFCSVQKIDL